MFCAHFILESDVMVVSDATNHTRFADNSMKTPWGHNFGLSAAMIECHENQMKFLQALSHQAMAQME